MRHIVHHSGDMTFGILIGGKSEFCFKCNLNKLYYIMLLSLGIITIKNFVRFAQRNDNGSTSYLNSWIVNILLFFSDHVRSFHLCRPPSSSNSSSITITVLIMSTASSLNSHVSCMSASSSIA